MSNYSHGVLTPGASRKRKERDVFDAPKASTAATPTTSQAEPTMPDNRLLAGYLAHEFLSKGTLFGQRWDPARADPPPPPAASLGNVSSSNKKPSQADVRAKAQAYADVAHLLKTDGPHIPGVVNPTQLGRWIQM